MKEMGVLFVSLIGGEILTYSGVEEIYTYLMKNGFYVNFTTNAISFSNSIPAWLLQYKPRYISVSVYGMSDATYEKLAHVKNGYTRTVQGIKNLLNAEISIKLNYCITPENLSETDAFFKFAAQYHIPTMATAYNYPPVRKHPGKRFDPISGTCPESSFVRLDTADAAEAELLIRHLRDPDKFKQTIEYLKKREFKQNTSKHSERFYCKAGSYSFWINWKGFMTPCGLLESPAVFLDNNTLKEAWEDLRETIHNIHICKECADCKNREICFACPASMHAETGSFSGKPVYLCHLTECMLQAAKSMDTT